MSEYIKTCKFCKQEIKMSDETGKWIALNKDGSAHDCRTNQDTKGHDISVAVLLKRLGQLGISIDLSKLRLVK